MSKNISLNKEIYPTWAIAQAVADYAALASISTYIENGRTICCFSGCRYDEVVTVNEFLNYLIDLLNSPSRT